MQHNVEIFKETIFYNVGVFISLNIDDRLVFNSPAVESATDLLFYKRLPNEKFLSYKYEIPSQTAIYNPFIGIYRNKKGILGDI
jgi:hypothetical protein